jgi:hypothetical protein
VAHCTIHESGGATDYSKLKSACEDWLRRTTSACKAFDFDAASTVYRGAGSVHKLCRAGVGSQGRSYLEAQICTDAISTLDSRFKRSSPKSETISQVLCATTI